MALQFFKIIYPIKLVRIDEKLIRDLCCRAGNFHARGHGLQSLGDMNQDELERKRLKTLEHQVISL